MCCVVFEIIPSDGRLGVVRGDEGFEGNSSAMNRCPDREESADAVLSAEVGGEYRDVCNGGGRRRELKLLLLEAGIWSLLGLRLAAFRPGVMTSSTSASNLSMLSTDGSLVMMDISNSFST